MVEKSEKNGENSLSEINNRGGNYIQDIWQSLKERRLSENEYVPIIRTNSGFLLYLLTMMFSFYGFLMILDLAPNFLGVSNNIQPGIYVPPLADVSPFSINWFALMLVIFLPLLVTLIVYSLTKTRENFDGVFRKLVVPTIACLVYLYIFVGFVEFTPWLATSRRTVLDSPSVFWLFLLGHLGLIFTMTLLYVDPLLPPNLDTLASKQVYFNHHWRIGRLVIGVTTAFVIGLSIPTILSIRDHVPIWGLVYFWAAFVPQFAAIAILSLLRARAAQKSIIDSRPISWGVY